MAEILLPETGLILTWVEFVDSGNNRNVWSMQALADPATYFGGFKEPRVIEMGPLVRALSDINGTYQGADFSLVLSDNDRVIRAKLNATSTKFFLNRSLVVRMIDDASRRAGLDPRTVMRGLVADYRPLADLQFQLGVQDVITRRFSSQVASLSQVPKRDIQLTDFPECPPASLYKPVPIIYGDVSDQNEYTTVVGAQPKFTAVANPTATHVGGPGTAVVKYVITLVGEETALPQWDPVNQQDERYMGEIVLTDAVGPTEDPFNTRFTQIEWDQPNGYATRIYGRFADTEQSFESGTFGFLGYVPKGLVTTPGSERVAWVEQWMRGSQDEYQPPANNMYVEGSFTPGGTILVDNAKGVIQPIYVGPKRFR